MLHRQQTVGTGRGMEATTGFEPVMKVLQTSALPLGYVAKHCRRTARRGLAPRETIEQRSGTPNVKSRNVGRNLRPRHARFPCPMNPLQPDVPHRASEGEGEGRPRGATPAAPKEAFWNCSNRGS